MEWTRHDCKVTKRRERFGEGYRFCPYCGVKLELPIAAEVAASESAEAKPDDEIAVTRNCLETWAYLAENMPGYGDFRAILAQSIRAVIPADRPKPSGKIELSRVLLEDWDERLRETAAPLCPSRTTRTILTIASHMRAILDSYAKDPPELPPVKIEVSRKKLEDWLAKANEIYHVFDAKCPMGREFCELAGKAAFIADCLSPRIQEVLDNDE